jgi:hypothetical protein
MELLGWIDNALWFDDYLVSSASELHLMDGAKRTNLWQDETGKAVWGYCATWHG